LLHVILGLILVIVAVCNPGLARRAFGLPARRPRRPEAGAGLDAIDKPVARAANADRTAASIPLSEVMCPPPNSGSIEWVWRKPFKPEKMLMYEWGARGREEHNYPWRYNYYNDLFRSSAEVEWAKTFNQLGLPWESEPLKFDMGPKHFSYTPDFIVTGLSSPGSDRPLYIEVKRFPDEVDLTKYVRFTEWYNCDLLVLAHQKGGVLKQRKARYFVVFRCPRCNTYECFACDHRTTEDYRPRNGPSVCQACQGTFERVVLPNYFLIQEGTIRTEHVVLEEHPTSGLRLHFR
jgi:hypothetical protein